MRIICDGILVGMWKKSVDDGQPRVYRLGDFIDNAGAYRRFQVIATERKHRKLLQHLPDGAPVRLHGDLALGVATMRDGTLKPTGVLHVTKLVHPSACRTSPSDGAHRALQ